MVYPYPDGANMTGLYDLLIYANQITYGWAVSLFILAIFFVAFFSLKVYATHRAFAGASFIAFIMTVVCFILKLVSLKVMILSSIAVVVAIVWLVFAEKIEY
jgi:hypothetical protein